MQTLDISMMTKAEALCRLYNASQPQGLGFLHFTPQDMQAPEAETLLEETLAYRKHYFDYLKGRVMKVDLSKDTLDPRLYDRDNGEGAAARALGLS